MTLTLQPDGGAEAPQFIERPTDSWKARHLDYCRQLGFDNRDLALGIGLHPNRIDSVLSEAIPTDPFGNERRSQARERLESLGNLAELVMREYGTDPAELVAWLREPHQDLGWRRPLAVIAEDEPRWDELVHVTQQRFSPASQ